MKFLTIAAATLLAHASTEQRIDLSKRFADKTVELQDGKETAAILVADQGAEPVVTWADAGLCDDVLIKSITHLPGKLVKIVTVPEFEFDDGVNSCAVTVTQPDGKKAVVTMFIDLD